MTTEYHKSHIAGVLRRIQTLLQDGPVNLDRLFSASLDPSDLMDDEGSYVQLEYDGDVATVTLGCLEDTMNAELEGIESEDPELADELRQVLKTLYPPILFFLDRSTKFSKEAARPMAALNPAWVTPARTAFYNYFWQFSYNQDCQRCNNQLQELADAVENGLAMLDA